MRRTIGLLLAAVLVAGCQASSGGAKGDAKVKVDIAPNASEYQVQHVAVLGSANTAGSVEADLMFGYILNAIGSRTRYAISTSDAFEADVRRAGVQEDFDRLIGAWRKHRLIDEAPLTKVLDATGMDAVLCMEATKWEQQKLEPTQEGTSNTMVGLRIELFAPDGTLLWSANHTKIEKSIPYNPEFNVRSTMSGEARTTSTSAVPDAPEIQKVAMDAAAEAVATMPNLTGLPLPGAGE